MQSGTATQLPEPPLRLVPAANPPTEAAPRAGGSSSPRSRDAVAREGSRAQQVIDWHARIDRLSGALASRWQASASPSARDVELERLREAWTDARVGFEQAVRAHLLAAD